jgi:hypothetical protein
MASHASDAVYLTLDSERGDHFRRHRAADGVEGGAVVAEITVAELNYVPEVSGLKLRFHSQRPFDVVRLRELRPGARAVGVADDALDDAFPRLVRVVVA